MTGETEIGLALLYFNGSIWVPVMSSGGTAPVQDMTDDLEGTISGGRYAVLFDDSSLPKITDLSGTIFTITVPDTEPPAVACPPPITAPASQNCEALVPDIRPQVVAADNCTPTDELVIQQQPLPGTSAPLGITLIAVTVADTSGNSSTCNTMFTVQDETPPVIVCPADLALPCSVERLMPVDFTATATDNCDAAPTVTYSAAPGTGFPIGATSVTVTAADVSGNVAQCTFTVTRAELGFTGFLPPIGGADATGGGFANPVRTFKSKSVIPVKFTASCDGASVVTGVHTLQAIKYSDETTYGDPIDATPQDSATIGNQFRLTDGEWHFNLDTDSTGMTAGIWMLLATLSDGSQHHVWIQVK